MRIALVFCSKSWVIVGESGHMVCFERQAGESTTMQQKHECLFQISDAFLFWGFRVRNTSSCLNPNYSSASADLGSSFRSLCQSIFHGTRRRFPQLHRYVAYQPSELHYCSLQHTRYKKIADFNFECGKQNNFFSSAIRDTKIMWKPFILFIFSFRLLNHEVKGCQKYSLTQTHSFVMFNSPLISLIDSFRFNKTTKCGSASFPPWIGEIQISCIKMNK